MSQPDYYDILRIAQKMGVEPSPSVHRPREPEVDADGQPKMVEGITMDEYHQMFDELQMYKSMIPHIDRQIEDVMRHLRSVERNVQEIARFRLTWMTGGIPSDSSLAKDLPKEWFDNKEVVA